MLNKIFFLFLFVLLLACNNSDTGKKADPGASAVPDTSAITPPPPASPVACYTQTTDKDTVRMQLRTESGKVSGNLQYKLFEKDQNTGTITGTMIGDTLFADYTFSSEGMTSVREVAFLKKEEGYTEGYGMPAEKNGKMVFKKGTLRFSDSLLLRRVDCQ